MSEKTNYKIGRDYELEVKRQLEAEGYIVFKPVWVKYAVKDVFGIFDLLAYHPVEKKMQLIQLTASSIPAEFNERVRKVRGFSLKEITVACIAKGGKEFVKKYAVVNSGA